MFGVFSRLHTHDGIGYNVDKGFRQSRQCQEDCHSHCTSLIEHIDADQCSKLQSPHHHYVRLSACASNRHIIADQAI